ncbi:MAG TPA: hypothetical protein VFT29_18545 [Gemmatimonadaceae bacterium]|nr:hypothetical protein [Gemmatimonadaceae bacterium]
MLLPQAAAVFESHSRVLPPTPSRAALGTVILWALALSSAPVRAPEAQASDSTQCTWTGIRPVKGPHRYRVRGDWCEGLYAKPVAETGSLAIVSLVQLARSGLDSARQLTFAWTADARDSVRIVAESLDPQTPYRMSALRTGMQTTFRWSLETARSEALRASQFGMLAWTWRRIGQQREIVLLPLRISTTPPIAVQDTFAASVVPSTDLKALAVSVGVVQPNGDVRWRYKARSLGKSLYLRDEPVLVLLPRVTGDSLLMVSLVGRTVGDGPVSREFFVRASP